MDSLISRARQLWIGLARAPVDFRPGEVTVAAAAGSLLCPPGWVGIVIIGDAAIATAPEESLAGVVREALQGLPVGDLTDPDPVRAQLPTTAILGPATLGYLAAEDFTPAPAPAGSERLPAGHPDLAALAASMPPEEAGEAGIDEIQSDAFAVRTEADVAAAAGYRRWLGTAAHLSVLTAPGSRGLGLGRAVASAATADALAQGLLPQWRARVEPSRRIARALGYRELGSQLSIRVEA